MWKKPHEADYLKIYTNSRELVKMSMSMPNLIKKNKFAKTIAIGWTNGH